ncbi:centrosomal protein of 70 kDa [Xenentodon cancila]
MDTRTTRHLSGTQTYVYLWTNTQFQQEQVEWDDVNKLLQHHGFKPVFFADPVENKNLSDLVLLDKKSAGEVRTTLKMMLTDSERRQALIQELVVSNNHLKEEAQKHVNRAARQSRRVTELESLLDEVKAKVQDLEDRFLCNTAQLQQDKREAKKRCELLEQKLSTLEGEAAELQKKLYFTVKEEEQRLARQTRSFQSICRTVSQQSSAADQQVLDVIDFYETKIARLQDELRGGALVSGTSQFPRRPEEDHTAEAIPTARQRSGESRMCVLYHRLLTEIHAVVTNPSAALRPSRLGFSADAPQLDDFQAVLPTLEDWSQQLHLLKDLQCRMKKLLCTLLPWQRYDGDAADAVKVEDLLLLVDVMLENSSAEAQQKLRSPTPYTLGSMVSHFQKLFDVPSLSGVFPRMNEVYTRLGEMTNAMRNLRDVLDMESRGSPAEVVNQVATLVSSRDHTPGVRDLLGDADIDSIITKVKLHDEFLPAFHALITDVLQVLGVSHLDDVLPALKSLKRTL